MDNDESIESMWKREADAASPDAVSNVPEESEEARAERVRIWRGLALPALVLGLLATILVYGNPASVTMPLFVIAVIAFFRHVMRLSGIQKPKRGSLFCFAVMLLLALSDCLTDNAFIITCNNIGICLVLAVALLHNFCDDRLWRLGTYFARMIRCAGGTVESLGDAVSDLLVWRREAGKGSRTVIYVLAGAAISAPLLAVVISLLCSADERYAAQLGWLFGHVQPGPAMRVCLFSAASVLVAYCTSRFLLKGNLPSDVKERRQFPAAVALTALTLFCLVYISFVLSQFAPPPDGASYAGTAREGFFQLLAVSVINVIIVQAVLARFGDCAPLKVLLSVFCACTYAMIASAALRMFRYIGHYGQLTFLRVLVLWTLAVLSLLLAGQAAQVFSRRFPLFRYGFAVTCACYVALSLARPDYWIADYNLAHIGQDRTELTYRGISDLRNLAYDTSCDAAPAFERAGMLRVDFACDALGRHVAESFDYRDVLREKLGDKPLTPRSWNFSRARARRIVQE